MGVRMTEQDKERTESRGRRLTRFEGLAVFAVVVTAPLSGWFWPARDRHPTKSRCCAGGCSLEI